MPAGAPLLDRQAAATKEPRQIDEGNPKGERSVVRPQKAPHQHGAFLMSSRAAVLSIVIVSSSLRDGQTIVYHAVDQAVLSINTSRPPTGQLIFQWLGLADSLKRVLLRIFDEPHHSLCHTRIRRNPMLEIFESSPLKFQAHPSDLQWIRIPGSHRLASR